MTPDICPSCHTAHYRHQKCVFVKIPVKTPEPVVKTQDTVVKTEVRTNALDVKTPDAIVKTPVKTFDKKAWMRDYMRDYMKTYRARQQ